MLHFKARLASPRYSYRLDTSGGWTQDPSYELPPDPSMCAFTHEHKNLNCRFVPWAPRTLISRFMLIPSHGRYSVHYNRINALPLSCQRHDGVQLLDSQLPTKLTESAVERLAPGKHVSASGTLVIPHDLDNAEVDEHHRGKERFKYTLTVKRVR